MTTNIRPLSDRVLVRRVEAETTSKGGIIIPPTASEKPTEAVVVAVGPGRILENGHRIEPNLKTGDRVLFGKYDGNEVKIDGVDHLILREENILGVVTQG
jgi:chaperonin GroES